MRPRPDIRHEAKTRSAKHESGIDKANGDRRSRETAPAGRGHPEGSRRAESATERAVRSDTERAVRSDTWTFARAGRTRGPERRTQGPPTGRFGRHRRVGQFRRGDRADNGSRVRPRARRKPAARPICGAACSSWNRGPAPAFIIMASSRPSPTWYPVSAKSAGVRKGSTRPPPSRGFQPYVCLHAAYGDQSVVFGAIAAGRGAQYAEADRGQPARRHAAAVTTSGDDIGHRKAEQRLPDSPDEPRRAAHAPR